MRIGADGRVSLFVLPVGRSPDGLLPFIFSITTVGELPSQSCHAAQVFCQDDWTLRLKLSLF